MTTAEIMMFGMYKNSDWVKEETKCTQRSYLSDKLSGDSKTFDYWLVYDVRRSKVRVIVGGKVVVGGE